MLKSRCSILLVFFAFTFASINTPLSKEVDENKTKIDWVPYSSGMAQAKARDKAVFLFFCADWCTNCAKMEKETFKDNSVIEYLNANFISIKVKIDREHDIANKYRVRGLPTIILIYQNGKSSGLLPGYFSADRLLGLLKKLKRVLSNKSSFAKHISLVLGTNHSGPGNQ